MRFFNRAYGTRMKNVYDYSGYTINRRKKRVYGKKTDNIKAGGATKNSSGNKITLKENAVARLIHSVIDFFAGKKTFFFIAFIVIVALFSLIPTERVIILGEKTYFAMEMAVLADEGTAYTLAGEIMALGGGNIIRKDDGFRILAS
ncbi:MAG: hypothetical protein IKC46_03640, partial [Lachnospiraceae bacterium]|nr:hypothetical protein [Lachnospiraceae bacterium]